MTTAEYIQILNERYTQGNATEHTFRSDLQNLLETLLPDYQATNEPKRIECGAPDFILNRKGNPIPIGYIEAKDIDDKDLEGQKKNGNKEQFDRYKAALGNIIFTDYLDFHFYQNGVFLTKIRIGEITEPKSDRLRSEGQTETVRLILAFPKNFATFENLLKDFCLYLGQNITNPLQLAQFMAGKAKLLAEVLEKSLISDEANQENSTLKEQLDAFRQILIRDIRPKGFADVYAQTITYGMFAARIKDTDLQTFNRQKAADLIPKSNPFLRKLFQYIAGYDLDSRIVWIVDSLAEVFLYANVEEILQNYGKNTQTEEPIIHFYETFLAEYDPSTRKSRGVWYSPKPVVSFIVRAVDEILRTTFGLERGLAEKIQILDPATGTGTFLAEAVRQIHRKFAGMQGTWANYVEQDLIPRLNGFELLMASYAMAHLQLDLLFRETGYQITDNQRVKIFLTNSLEEGNTTLETSFASWLSAEANEANRIKKQTPLMVVLGNPPYAVSSSNRNDWIQGLIADYKKGLKETKLNLDDDYIKFIRLGQHFVEKNGFGVLAYISNNSFLDGVTHRQMRKSLLQCFDQIYVLDLHGSARKKESDLEGLADQNVFDIMQGVSINIFVKTGKKAKGELGKVLHCDLQGKRQAKFDFLNENTLKSVKWQVLDFEEPYYFFVPKDFSLQTEYEEGFKVTDLFVTYNSGVKTDRDALFIDFEPNKLEKRIKSLFEGNYDYYFKKEYRIENSSSYQLLSKIKKVQFSARLISPIQYRPFDYRYIYYDPNLVSRAGYEVFQHYSNGRENIGLIASRQFGAGEHFICFISKSLHEISSQPYAPYYNFPLYLYPETPKIRPISEKEKNELQIRLKQAKEHYKQIRDFFNKTVLPFFNTLQNPDEAQCKLFEENKSIYEEAKATVEKLEGKIREAESPNLPSMLLEEQPRKPNLDMGIVQKIAEKIGLEFVAEKSENQNEFSPIDLLDYVYGVLHSPAYREKYQSFLKIDFPRVPYPESFEKFRTLANLGSELRKLHLLESPLLDELSTNYPESGNNLVENTRFAKTDRIYINENQYFDKVSESVWNFYVGGYQPAQKWLKDRKDRNLTAEEILHYQKLIGALTETQRIMGEIDFINYSLSGNSFVQKLTDF